MVQALIGVFRTWLLPPPPCTTLFPYTTLFRSLQPPRVATVARAGHCWRLSDAVIGDRKSTRLNSSHVRISYAVFCLKKKNCAVLPTARHIVKRSVTCHQRWFKC